MAISSPSISRRKLLLKCHLSPGDIVMLTAAVRDLHRCHPNQFITGVSTSCSELWENNPLVARFSPSDHEVEEIRCHYPLINSCNQTPYHCLHGFIQYLNQKLELNIRPSAFKGDIYLSEKEKSWYSQVYELTHRNIPFWIIDAGGKYDVPIKWWDAQRYQKVVAYFRGRIQFVQVGQLGHHHPKLEGVIDLRGKTDLRQLVRLVYHAQGVLCPVTALMHLAAAVEPKHPKQGTKPCVVVAGGREPAHWEAYPNHQFIHNNGALPCCAQGGCWKDRYEPLGDGDRRDALSSRCTNISNGLPRCMDLITADEVIRRIEGYFEGGVLHYLSKTEEKHAQKAIRAAQNNNFDRQALNLHSARLALERRLLTLTDYPFRFHDRGIVIGAAEEPLFPAAWICIHMLRRMKCHLPIELWHLGDREMSDEMRSLLAPLGVVCIDARKMRTRYPARILNGRELKAYALLHSSFEHVLFLDANTVPLRDPTYLFDSSSFRTRGAVFWPNPVRTKGANRIWRSCGMTVPKGPEFETGQVLVDKRQCWRALCLALWFNENSDFYYQYLQGDKETFHLAFAKLKTPFIQISTPVKSLEGVLCQHDFDGNRIFQHRNSHKWTLIGRNHKVPGFLFEAECLASLRALKRKWSGSPQLQVSLKGD